ncbi:hypothetical protein G6M87_11090 [Rhizobium rhizogenes]|uniref:hypothetical protein n=1 Tax=Rhizobium rhizogenes TaxID=359 RepID=UPI00157359A0|nr:hypothetical protein [Rhizobium rhizogenes]NTI22404.1 hypothetical protein [Rhizobium rhizogenes]QTG05987.1 hypothetical protein G6M87_11090 [Rhizobium rhizogenes]
MEMKYEHDALKAIEAGLTAFPAPEAWRYWKALGVTRQTSWRWKTMPSLVPLMARLAVSWMKHTGAVE